MVTEKDCNKEEILLNAQKVLYYNDLLVKQCDSWLSEEEGRENMMCAILERNCAKKESRLFRLFGSKLK